MGVGRVDQYTKSSSLLGSRDEIWLVRESFWGTETGSLENEAPRKRLLNQIININQIGLQLTKVKGP